MGVLGIGSALGGLMGGKGGKGGTPSVNLQPSPYEQAMAKIAQEYYKATGPTRGYFLEDWANFLRPSGGTGWGAGTGGSYTPGYWTGGTGTGTGTGAATTPNYGSYGLQLGPSGSLTPLVSGTPTQVENTPRMVGMSGPFTAIYDIGGRLFYAPAAGGLYDYFQQQLGNFGQTMGTGPGTSPTRPFQKTGTTNTARGKPFNPSIYQGSVSEYMPYQGPTSGSGVQWLPGYTPPSATGGGQGTWVPGQYQQGTSGGGSNLFGGYDPYKIPGYAPIYQLARGGIESQFKQAREGIIGSTPRGGALAEGLGNLEIARAVEAGSLPAQIATPLIQDILNKAYGAAFGAPTTTLSGLGGAASSYAGRYGSAMAGTTAANQMGMAGMGGLGSLAAMGLGGKGGKGAGTGAEYMLGGGIFA